MENKEKLFKLGLAAFTVFMGFALVILLMFLEIPEGNKSIVDMSIGLLIGTGVIGVITFYYGSSAGSQSKDKMLLDKE